MGWASGNEVFGPVADALISTNAPPNVTQAVCEALISRLRSRGWDTEEESLGLYEEHPAIVRAFAAHGVHLRCFDEADDGDICEERRDHKGDHKNYQGKTWPQVGRCERCGRPFDPPDTRFDGHAQYQSTPWCGSCVDLCYEGTADHRCVICDS